MTRNAIIVGAPRSGTSLTSSVFAKLGYYCGDSAKEYVRQGDDYNPFGYFEADDIIEANVRLFQRVGYTFHNTWVFERMDDEVAARIGHLSPAASDRQLIAAYDQRIPWLMKDPRLCLTLPYWSKLIDWKRTVVVLVHRDPEDVYWSFRRKGWAKGDATARRIAIGKIEQHFRSAKNAVEQYGLPHVTVNYEDYKTRPAHVVQVLNNALDLQLTIEDLNFRGELDHSSWYGRLSGCCRMLAKRLPRKSMRRLESLIPRVVLAQVFPERHHR
jgi:hypothetical protein